MIRVGKLDAARRQLDTAIRLYFQGGDAISVHTLASAGVQLLDDLLRKKGLGETIRLDFFGPLTKDQKKAAVTVLRREERFFKHADRDPGDVLAFKPGASESVLFRGCIGYVRLAEATTRDMAILVAWIALNRSGYESFKYYHSISGKICRDGKTWTTLDEFYRNGIRIANTGKAQGSLGTYHGLGLPAPKPRYAKR
jgi:hypothetical protein